MRVEAIATVEEAVLDVDRLISNAALREVLSSLNLMSEEGKELERRAVDQVDTLELSISSTVFGRCSRKEQLASDLRDGGMKNLVEDRSGEIDRLMEATSEAIAEGDKERAQQLAQRLAERLGEMADAIREEVERSGRVSRVSPRPKIWWRSSSPSPTSRKTWRMRCRSRPTPRGGSHLRAARCVGRGGAGRRASQGRLQAHADALVEADRIFNEQELVFGPSPR